MPFRRRSVQTAKTVRTLQAAIEPLEKRQLLTALVNGVFQGTGTAFDGTSIFEFRQGTNVGTTYRISVVGNITAEFIGGVTGVGNTPVTLTDLVPAGTPTNTDPRSVYLFSIYVVQADMNSAISISAVNNFDRMDPFAGTISPFGPANVPPQPALQMGSAYLGVDPAAPLIFSGGKRFGMRPSSAGEIIAGIKTAPGVSLGKFFFAGTVTGVVDIAGSMDQFYCGNLYTGQVLGVGATGVVDFVTTPQLRRNFHVGGDIRNITVGDEIGVHNLPANPQQVIFKSGVRIDIGGSLGELSSVDDMGVSVTVHNDPKNRGPGTPVRETEYIGANLPQNGAISYFDPQYWGYDISIADISPDPRFTNDTFATAQYLSTTRSRALKNDYAIQVYGQFGPGALEGLDFYALPLLAGQSIDVQMLDRQESLGANPLHVGIFDPEGRLLTTDYTKINENIGLGSRATKPMHFTAPRAGVYRIALGNDGDYTFGGTVSTSSGFLYELRITGAGNIGLGGIRSTGTIGTMDATDTGIDVLHGDLGGVQSTSDIYSFSLPWRVTAGNFRSMEGGSLSISGATIFIGSGPDFLVKGSVGVLRNTSAQGRLAVNDDAQYPTSASAISQILPSLAVGKNIQLVDAAGSVEGALIANGGIGVIRAASIGADIGGVFIMADVDRTGNDGIIDLIDVTTTFAGPAIATGPNGNVRYLHIDAAATVTRDPRFGGGTPNETIYDPGETARVVDDSGTEVFLTPTPLLPQPAGSTSVNPLADPPQLTLLTYPIRGKSGVVIIRATVAPLDDTTDGVTSNGGGGLLVETGSKGSDGSVEIGEITVAGNTSNTFTFDPVNRVYTVTAVPAPPTLPIRDVNVILQGDSRVDVWNIDGTGSIISNITNNTVGEVVNITGAPDVLNIQTESLGLAESHSGSAVEGVTVRNNVYPFANQKNLVELGNVVDIRSRRGLGNILAVNVGNVRANSDGKNIRGLFEGINGPIVATDGTTSELTGNIASVDIGEGIASSGTGLTGFSGIYARGLIDRVVGNNADIRGNIVATADTTRVTVQATDPVTGAGLTNPDGTPLMLASPTYDIGQITLNNGSIVQAAITTTTFDISQVGVNAFTSLEQADTYDTPFYDIGSIRINRGGIIGSVIFTSDLGAIKIEDGFGIVTSRIAMAGTSVAQGIDTDGFGVRDTVIDSGGGMKLLNARGDGRLVPTSAYPASLRFSEKGKFDPYTGELLDIYNDLHRYLGTSTRRPKSSTMSGTGVIMDTSVFGARDLGKVEAQRIIARRTFFIDPLTGTRTRVAFDDPVYPMRFTFANSNGSIVVRDNIDGLYLSGGEVGQIAAGKDIIRTLVEISGELKSVTASQLRSSAAFLVEGSDGAIGSISTRHNMFSTINASQGIDRISVGGDIGAKRIQAGGNLGELTVNGSILTGTTVRIGRTLDELFIGRDLKANATIRAKAINEQTINGQIIGDIIIA
jgi:hypothetical protein